MKKFMKAIAFVTVMCMALSTVAFAAGSLGEPTADKTFTVTVTDAGTDQVALLVVEKDADRATATPLYIDQKPADNGTAAFTAKIAKNVAAVDVYVGYATYAAEHNEAYKVGTVTLSQPVTEVTITNVNCTWELYHDDSEGSTMEQSATGAVISFNFEAPEGVSSSQMGWQITYVDPVTKENKTVYSDAFDISEYSLGSVIESGSNVTLGLAFLNGSEKNGIGSVEIVDIKARFLFVGEALEDGSQYIMAEDDTPNQD